MTNAEEQRAMWDSERLHRAVSDYEGSCRTAIGKPAKTGANRNQMVVAIQILIDSRKTRKTGGILVSRLFIINGPTQA